MGRIGLIRSLRAKPAEELSRITAFEDGPGKGFAVYTIDVPGAGRKRARWRGRDGGSAADDAKAALGSAPHWVGAEGWSLSPIPTKVAANIQPPTTRG